VDKNPVYFKLQEKRAKRKKYILMLLLFMGERGYNAILFVCNQIVNFLTKQLNFGDQWSISPTLLRKLQLNLHTIFSAKDTIQLYPQKCAQEL
jgi:hypothetical protein